MHTHTYIHIYVADPLLDLGVGAEGLQSRYRRLMYIYIYIYMYTYIHTYTCVYTYIPKVTTRVGAKGSTKRRSFS